MGEPGTTDTAVKEVATWFRAHRGLEDRFGRVIRRAIDEVIDGQRTGRFDPDSLAKTEKTYLGTKVEILVQDEFHLERGAVLDYRICGHEVDAKWSARRGGWMIPTEAVGHLCLCMTASDHDSRFAVGIARADDALLNAGANKDRKRSFSKHGALEIEWLVPNGHLPENLLLHLDPADRDEILTDSLSGQARINELFRRVQGRIVRREVVLTVSRQLDGPKRVRDSRKALAREGIVILGHQGAHPNLARELELPVPRKGEWVSARTSHDEISPDY